MKKYFYQIFSIMAILILKGVSMDNIPEYNKTQINHPKIDLKKENVQIKTKIRFCFMMEKDKTYFLAVKKGEDMLPGIQIGNFSEINEKVKLFLNGLTISESIQPFMHVEIPPSEQSPSKRFIKYYAGVIKKEIPQFEWCKMGPEWNNSKTKRSSHLYYVQLELFNGLMGKSGDDSIGSQKKNLYKIFREGAYISGTLSLSIANECINRKIYTDYGSCSIL